MPVGFLISRVAPIMSNYSCSILLIFYRTINYGKGSTQQCVELKNAVGTYDYARFRVTLKEGGGDKAKYELTLLDDNESSSLVTGNNFYLA